MKINLNELAQEITLAEGKKISISNAQTKEVLSCLGRRWLGCNSYVVLSEVAALINAAYKSQGAK